MEEILASIRQIISEDGGSAAPKIDGVIAEPARATRAEEAGHEHGRVEPEPPAAIEDYQSTAEAAEDEPAAEREIEPEPNYGEFMRRASEHDTEMSEPEPAPRRLRAPVIAAHTSVEDEEDPLLSPESGEAISGAFGALANTLLAHNHTRTLEDVVAEMLQPMLKQWLDDNLPSIVERKVQEEIERVSRGRR